MSRLRLVLAGVVVVMSLGFTAAPAAAEGCSPSDGVGGKIATLYKKVTGDELIYCP